MDENNEDDLNKIIRVSKESLVIELSQKEIEYRNKFLPDPTSLNDVKLVCTVCTRPLAQFVHKGNDIYVHKTLEVLMCEGCYNFYGDGYFSADEDGDDKYCRWCGQGGTLYLCSACTVGFCETCLKINLKSSVLANLERNDWKCFFCHPRPIFGSRTICWAAQELNRIGKEKKRCKLKLRKEKLKQMAEAKERKEEEMRANKKLFFEDISPKKRKRGDKDSDSSSVEIPPKRTKHNKINTDSLNGTTKQKEKRKKTVMNSESKTSKSGCDSKSRNKHKESSSSNSEDSFVKSSDETGDDNQNASKTHFRSHNELKHRKHKKKTKSTGEDYTSYSSDSYGSDYYRERKRRNKLRKRKKRNSSIESLKNNKRKKKRSESSSDLSDNEQNIFTESEDVMHDQSAKLKPVTNNLLDELNEAFDCGTESSTLITNQWDNQDERHGQGKKN